MARTTSAAVIAVLQRDYDAAPEVGSPPSLTPYIDTASAIVDDIVAYGARYGVTLADERLELIERWLSAHHYQQSDKGYASKSASGASASFQGQTGKGLSSTKYGQSAIGLDTTGYLSSLVSALEKSVAARADMFWGGTKKSSRTTYTERN